MSLFVWKPSYEIGINEIDMQHRQLVGMINELFEAIHGGQTGAAVEHVLDQLADYVKLHFRTEERYMQEHHYPHYAEHRQRHLELTRHVLAYHDRRGRGEAIGILELIDFLRDWLVEHITRQDRDFGNFLKKQRRLSTC